MNEEADETAIVAAIKAAETRTSGQILCVLARSSCDAGAQAWLYASGLALLTPWPLLSFTQIPAQHVFAIQVAVFALSYLLLSSTGLGLALLPRAVRRRAAFRVAAEQFYTRGLTRTRRRAGVLIFVSLAEHYARIIADDGLSGKVSEHEWQEIVDRLTSHLREGRVTEGYIGAIDGVAALLARAAPPDEGANELPDALVRL